MVVGGMKAFHPRRYRTAKKPISHTDGAPHPIDAIPLQPLPLWLSKSRVSTLTFHSAARAAAVCALLFLAGCNRLSQDHSRQALEAGDQKYSEGDYQGAVRYYEDAIDGTPATADIHYKLALLFDDKLKNPLAAMYHFQRYLDLKPTGSHAKEAGNFMKEDELKLVNSLSHGALMSQEDAARLKNDNLALRKQIDDLRAAARPVLSRDTGAQPGSTPRAVAESGGGTNYVVQSGDTLASIARKFYKNSARWKDIEKANYGKLKGSSKLKPGMILVIPK